ncbi:YqaJ viral recombinase family nuclease [Actinophytocola sediminis]
MCGLSPWATPYQVWLEKTGRADPEPDLASLERMRWGTLLEPVLLAEWDERNPEYILTGGAGLYADAEYPWMLATVDGLAWTPDQALAGVVEAKTGSHRTAMRWAEGETPVYYVTQVQWYMRILGAPRAFVCALLDTSSYVERVIERDDELITDLVEVAEEFWSLVEHDEPPPVDGSEITRRTLARARAHAGEEIELDRSWLTELAHRAELTETISLLEAERAVIDNRVRAALSTAEAASVDGQRVATHKASAKPSRSCAYDAFAAEHPDLYARYVTEKPASRRLLYPRPTPQPRLEG